MVNNGSFHYDHDRDGTHTALDGCEAKFREAQHETFFAIRYERNRLMVCHQLFYLGRNWATTAFYSFQFFCLTILFFLDNIWG